MQDLTGCKVVAGHKISLLRQPLSYVCASVRGTGAQWAVSRCGNCTTSPALWDADCCRVLTNIGTGEDGGGGMG